MTKEQIAALRKLQEALEMLSIEYDNSPDEFGMMLDYKAWFGKDLLEMHRDISHEIEKLQR
jgi:hypothetical protein